MTETFDHVVIGLGALGSATAYELARRGHSVVGLERFALGHHRGASHDTSRILRHSYHTPEYVRLTQEAYDDWERLEQASGERLVTVVGGLDLFPANGAIRLADYTDSLTQVGIAHELFARDAIVERWPQFSLPDGTTGLYQERAAIVPAGRGTALLQTLATRHGATLRDHSPVTGLRDLGDAGFEITVGTARETSYRCRSVVVCADAWTNDVLGHLDHRVPLTVTLEQATYFSLPAPDAFAPGRLPLWIWMDEPSFYGFPTYGEQTLKAAQDCGGPSVDPDDRGDQVDLAMLGLLARHVGRILPGAGLAVRSLRCQYTLTPDRDLVLDRVPGHPGVVVGLGAAHGFKFAPTIGRLLADLATGERETVSETFSLTRAALTDPDHPAHWLV